MQGELEAALAQVLRRDDLPHLVVAGRTDAGVHARGQVAHLDLPVIQEEPTELGRRLNGALPHDIRIRRVSEAPPHFDARFGAVSRTYSYRIADTQEAVDPLRRRDTIFWPRPLDRDALSEASRQLMGLRDFAAYCKRREGATTVRTLLRLDWVRDDTGVLVATVQADAFCHSMVRSLMGALIAVGEGRREPSWPGELLGQRERSSKVLVAPPHGLTLEHVEYPPDDQLAARQQITRRSRG